MDSPHRTIRDVEVIELQVESLDADTADEVRAGLAHRLRSARRVVLDLKQVQFADSSGLRTLFYFLRTLNAAGGDMKVCNVSHDVRHAFDVVGVQRVIDVHASVEEAVQAFQQ